ncbi:MAG: HdeD family acid-resistance protein [Beijerinckiaceae bacterium]
MTDAGSGTTPAQGPDMADFRSKYAWFIALGVVLLLLGAYALFNLFAATIASVFFIGVLMIIGGVARVVHAFQVEKKTSLAFWLISGVLYAVAGAMVLANPVLGAAVFTLLLAASLIASGVIMIIASFSSRAAEGRWWILLSGIVTAIAGLILASGWPLSGVWALGMILAIDLTFQGWALIAFGLALKAAK